MSPKQRHKLFRWYQKDDLVPLTNTRHQRQVKKRDWQKELYDETWCYCEDCGLDMFGMEEYYTYWRPMILEGFIEDVNNYDYGDGLKVGEEYLSEWLEDNFNKKFVYCVYGFSHLPLTVERLLTIFADSANGIVDAEHGDFSSEVTGYLWTDDEGNIGGHSITDIFKSHHQEYGIIVVQETPIDLISLL